MVLFKQRTTLVYSKTASIITWQPLSREHFLSSVDVQSKYFDRLVISTKWLLFQKGAMSTKFYIFLFGVVKQQSINTKNNLCMGLIFLYLICFRVSYWHDFPTICCWVPLNKLTHKCQFDTLPCLIYIYYKTYTISLPFLFVCGLSLRFFVNQFINSLFV